MSASWPYLPNKIEAYSDKKLPPFVNGLVGYLGYDTIQYFEKIDLHENDTLKQNDFELIIADRVIIYDSLTHKLFIVLSESGIFEDASE